MASFNVNNDAAVELTNKLEKLNRSAFPVAIRQTLNNTARDVKTRSVLIVTEKEFTNRSRNFFKVFTGFIPASGFNVNSMRSTVGIFPKGNQSAKDLVAQEYGGKVSGRSFIPSDAARVGKSHEKKVSKAKALNKFKNSPRVAWGNKAKFNRTVQRLNKGEAVIYGNTLMVLQRKLKNKKTPFKMQKLWTYKSGRSANISKASNFMMKSAMLSRKKMLVLYNKEAERQFKKALKK